ERGDRADGAAGEQRERGDGRRERTAAELAGIDTELLARERVERGGLVPHELRRDALGLGLRQPLRLVDERQLVLLGLRRLLELLGFLRDLRARELPRVGDREPLPERHRAGASNETRKAR